MKRMLGLIASLALIASITPVLADGYNGYNNKNNQFQNWQNNKQKRHYKYYKDRKHHNNNNNDYDAWQIGGAFVGGLILGDILGNQPYAPPAYGYGYEVGPQPYYQSPPPVWAAPRYCGPEYRYDEWGRIVQTYGCYR